MACVIVNDASCLIDLRKGRLLHAMLSLPHRFVVPFPVRVSELLDFTAQEWRLLDDGGMETFDLPPDSVGEGFGSRLDAHGSPPMTASASWPRCGTKRRCC